MPDREKPTATISYLERDHAMPLHARPRQPRPKLAQPCDTQPLHEMESDFEEFFLLVYFLFFFFISNDPTGDFPTTE